MPIETPAPARLPPWLKIRLPGGEVYNKVREKARLGPLHTVCQEARCPNLSECWSGGTATFMVLGQTCTRGCRFCSVATARKPAAPDPEEPSKLAESLRALNLKYAVITTVCRDDLPDQGAGHITECVKEIRRTCPDVLIEFLIQDFRGDIEPLRRVVAASPDVLAHNLETVQRLTHPVRDAKAGYRQSLRVLKEIKRLDPKRTTKTSLMLGLGETEEEIFTALQDLRDVGTDIVTLGQYLRPTNERRHLPVAEYVRPEIFEAYGKRAREMGFLYVASGPFVRSSYRAGELFLEGYLKSK